MCPESLHAEQSLFSKPRIVQPHAADNGLGHVPVALTTASVADRLASRDAESNEHFAPTLRPRPLFPVAHPNAATYPLIEPVEQLQLERQAEVTHPATNVLPQLRQ